MATLRTASYKLEFRAYRRNFLKPVVTAHGTWTAREGVIVRLTDKAGCMGYGEAAPIPHFTTETAANDWKWLRQAPKQISRREIQETPRRLACVQWALSCALAMLEGRLSPPAKAKKLTMAVLLPAGTEALQAMERKSAEGYRIFKWKVGVKSPHGEISLLEKLIEAMPKSATLRLDANGGLSRAEWMEWCEGLQALGGAVRRIEFFEQPWPPGKGVSGWREQARLAAQAPVPVALDESVAGLTALKKARSVRWRGPLVVKPSLLGEMDEFMRWRSPTRANFIYSSALETSVGLHALLFLAATDPQAGRRAFGYGMRNAFPDDGLLLPMHELRPNLAPSRLTADDFSELWNRLA